MPRPSNWKRDGSKEDIANDIRALVGEPTLWSLTEMTHSDLTMLLTALQQLINKEKTP